MQVQLKPWGNSRGIRLSKQLLRDAGIGEDDVLNVEVVGQTIVLSPEFTHKSLKERAAVYDGQLNLAGEVTRDNPSGSEVW